MKEVFSSASPASVALRKTVLENAGILCFVRNETSQQAIARGVMLAFFPVPDFWPTLCVMNEEDFPAAMDVLRDVADEGAAAWPEWKCSRCGEMVPGHFTQCWNCDQKDPN